MSLFREDGRLCWFSMQARLNAMHLIQDRLIEICVGSNAGDDGLSSSMTDDGVGIKGELTSEYSDQNH